MKFEIRLLFLLILFLTIYLNLTKQFKKIGKFNSNKNLQCDSSNTICSVYFKNFPVNIKLTWGGGFKELDLYVRRKDGQSVYYGEKYNFDGKVQFLNNTTTQQKGKIITMQKINSGKYLVFVKNFPGQEHIGKSKANIKITIRNNDLLNLNVPKSDNNPSNLIWIIGLMIFDQKKSIFKIVNKFSSFEQINFYYFLPNKIQPENFCGVEKELPTSPNIRRKKLQNISSVPGTGGVVSSVPCTEKVVPYVPGTEKVLPYVAGTEIVLPYVAGTGGVIPSVPGTENVLKYVVATEKVLQYVVGTEKVLPYVPYTEKVLPYVHYTEKVLPYVPGAKPQNIATNPGKTHNKQIAPEKKPETSIVQIIHKRSGLCLDAEGANIENFTKILLSPCNEGKNQKWYQKIEGNKYEFGLKNNEKYKVIAIEGVSKTNNARLILFESNGGDNQKWFWDATNGVLKNVNSGKCLDVPLNKANAYIKLSQYDCNNTNAQIFEIKKIN